MAVIIALTTAFAAVGLGAVGRLFFVAAALAAAAFYIRRSPWQYVTMTFWFWTLTPLTRRLIDFYAGFDPVNFILATPNLMTLFMLKEVLSSRELLRQKEAIPGLLILLPVLYGLGVNFVQGDILSGAVASADWIGPLFYYFYILANWRRIQEADLVFRNFVSINGFVVVVYGLIQFFAPMPWDVAWVIDSGLTSIGLPVPYGLRVFGTLNIAGIFAIWVGTLLLLSLYFRTWLSLVVVPAGVMALLLTFVRAEAGAVVIGIVLAALMGRADILKALGMSLIAVVLVIAGFSMVEPDVTMKLAARFGTVTNLGEDDSAYQREAIYAETPALINAHPFGLGLGATGRGAVAGENSGLVTVDSGPLAIYLSLGWVGGTVYLVGLFLIIAQAVLVARGTRSPAALALAIASLAGVSILVFANVLGLPSALICSCAAYAAAIGIASRSASARSFVPVRSCVTKKG